MTKSKLCVGLISLLSVAVYANEVENPTSPATTLVSPQTTPVAPSATSPSVTNQVNNTAAPSTSVAPPAAPLTQTNSTLSTVPAAPAAVINCAYAIPAQQATVDINVVSQWAEKATEQAFDFDYNNIDSQLSALQACFTDQGWKSFNDALGKSGNIDAIKQEKLTVSSMIDGQITASAIKDNQWKVSLPTQVVYQNETEKLNQLLTINLIIGRKISGDLGIMQMIATPRQPVVNTPIAAESANIPMNSPDSTTSPTTSLPDKNTVKLPNNNEIKNL